MFLFCHNTEHVSAIHPRTSLSKQNKDRVNIVTGIQLMLLCKDLLYLLIMLSTPAANVLI